MKKNIYLVFLLFLSSSVSACIIDQLVAETNNGINWPTDGPTWGQSFVACETGPVWEVAFWPNQTTTGLHTLILTDINCVTMWTVSNINLPGTGNKVVVDLSTGSGTSRMVTSGSAYIFQLIGPAGSNLQINLSWNNPYTAGEDRAANCASYGLDWWFRVGINEGLSVLPVELTTFDAAVIEESGSVKLNFETASESGASHYDIEHSTDGRFYQTIGSINAAGTSAVLQSYKFVHENPPPRNNYYRLKLVDTDGSWEHSIVVQVAVKFQELPYRISPNPTAGNIQVYFDQRLAKNIRLRLSGLDGRMLIIQDLADGVQNFSFDGNKIPAGIYFLQAVENGQFLWVEKVIKH